VSDNYEPPSPPPYDPYEDLVDLTGEEPLPPLEDPMLPPATPPRSPLLTGLILGLLLVVLSIAIFNLTRDDGTPTAGETTTTLASTTTTGDESTQTTASETTDGQETSTTTTSTTAANFEPYTAIGQKLSLDDLKLQTGGLGSIKLGSDAADAVGRLVATFGDPTSDTGPIVSTGEYGACEGGTVRIVKFGALAVVVIIDADGTETFAGYRLDLSYDGAATSEAVDLETLSGMKVGFNVAQLRDIYSGFDVEIVNDPDYGPVFELRGGSGNLLLWGPVLDESGDASDTVMGIYSADPAGTFC
jgi:hypothetical protein